MLRATAASWYRRMPRRVQIAVRRALGPFRFRQRVGRRSVVPPGPRRPVSVVIPSYNDLPFLRRCVPAVLATTVGFEIEVIIVDDSCEPANRPGLAALAGPSVRVIHRDERGGFARAVNTGMRQARHDVVLLNSDTVPLAGWLDALQSSAVDGRGRSVISTAKLIYPDGLIQYGGTYHTWRSSPQWFGHLWLGKPASDPPANVGWWVRAPSGACMYVPRAIIDEIGYFDEEFWLGFEDVDYGMRAWAAGFRNWYEPSAVVVHHESASRGYSQGRRELESMRHYWSRWRRAPASPDETVPIRLISSADVGSLRHRSLAALASRLRSAGVDTTLIRIADASPVDEAVVADLRESRAVVVACDLQSAQTAWLASEQCGYPVMLLSDYAPARARVGANERAVVRAALRPEFDYVMATQEDAEALRRDTGWAATAVLALVAHEPRAANESERPADLVVTLGADSAVRAAVDGAAATAAAAAVHLPWDGENAALLDDVAMMRPRAVVWLGTSATGPTAPLAVMAIGAGTILLSEPGLSSEIMDGMNALVVDPSRRGSITEAVTRAVADLLQHPQVAEEIARNAATTIRALADGGPRRLGRIVRSISERSAP